MRSSGQMVFDDPSLISMVGRFVEAQADTVNLYSVNQLAKQENYRKDTFKEVLRDCLRKDAFNDQYFMMRPAAQNDYLQRPPIPQKPNERPARSELARSVYGAGWPNRSPLFPVSKSDFRKAPGIYK